ncbi:hypothetical protein A6R68_00033 [Neotoma lepida]|uniref:Uncharacterized protein n=1 Tax=Neotoma lepida TaxID=56216 RepID=A0A1A6GZ82_NEOLE|nr:hypothetical protein A6R68_00033 [Neotoma lepida]
MEEWGTGNNATSNIRKERWTCCYRMHAVSTCQWRKPKDCGMEVPQECSQALNGSIPALVTMDPTGREFAMAAAHNTYHFL